MNPNELRAKRAELLDQRKALHEAATGDQRDLTNDEQIQFDSLGEQAAQIKTQIDRAEAIELEQTELSSSTRRTGTTVNTNPHIRVTGEALADDPAGGYGERGFGQFAHDVYLSRSPSDAPQRLRSWVGASRERALAAGDGMNSSIGSEGAYLIPPQFGALIDRVSLESAIIRPRATKIPMTSKSVPFPCVDDTSHSSGTVFGGVQAYFKSEEAALTSSKPSLSEVTLTVHRLTALAYVSGEMLDFSPISLDSWLPNKLAQALTWKEEDKFVSGVGGAGEPIGLLYSDCIIEVTAETGQSATTIVTENLVKMLARVWRIGGQVIWLANRTCETQLPFLTVGTGAVGQPAYLPPTGVSGAMYSTLFGAPVLYTEHCSALGTAGDIMCVNAAEYLVGDASSKTRADRDIGLKFDYDQTAYRVITYTGGMMPWRSAFTPQNGDSLSPVVSLASRT